MANLTASSGPKRGPAAQRQRRSLTCQSALPESRHVPGTAHGWNNWKACPLEGGLETRVTAVRPETWADWEPAPGADGIYFVQSGNSGQAELLFYDLKKNLTSQLGTLPTIPFWLSTSPDGKSVFYEHLDQENSHIMLMNDFSLKGNP